MNPTLKYMKEKPSAATQIDTDITMARLDVTIVLYFTGDATATYLSIVRAASVKIDAVLEMKYRLCKILMSTTFS